MIATDSVLFVCPKCGESAVSIHRKTYEGTVIVFCSRCRLNEAFEPSKEAHFDLVKCFEEFTNQYRQKKQQ